MRYALGVDLGTTYTAAAVRWNGHVEVAQLGTRRAEIPSLVFFKPDGVVLVGEAADRRSSDAPSCLAREFKRRIGDRVPIVLGGIAYDAPDLMALLLQGVLETVVRQQECAPSVVSLTCPANWGPYRRGLLEKAVHRAGTDNLELHVEPEAAAIQFASSERVQPGEVVAVYDLGGGTFDAAVLRKTPSGFELLGEPAGVEHLGGLDFDEAVFEHVLGHLGSRISDLDSDDPMVYDALRPLRRDCAEAKEALSYDTDTTVPVTFPGQHTRIRITRPEFEAMVADPLQQTVHAMDRALRSAAVNPASLRAILLAGGSSRIPMISHILSAYERPLVLDPQAEHSIALGAARAARAFGDGSSSPQAPTHGAVPATPPGSAAAPGGGPPPQGIISSRGTPTKDADPSRPPGTAVHVEQDTGTGRNRGVPSRALVAAAVFATVVIVGVALAIIAVPGQPQGGAPSRGWVAKQNLPVALEGAAVAAYQNKIWVAGGLSNDRDRTKLTTVYIYDPDADSWVSGPSLPRPISHGALVATPWTLYFLGGWVQDGGSSQVLRLNDTNSAWVPDVPLPEPRVAGGAAYDGTQVVYAAGTRKGGFPTDTVWGLRGGRWVSLGHLAAKRTKVTAVSNEVDTVYVLGGTNFQTNKKSGTVDRISQGRVLPPEKADLDAISPPVDSGVGVWLEGTGMCLLGGETPGNREFNDWWCEQPGAARDLPKLEPQRAGLGAAVIGRTLYVVGGYGATFQGTSKVEAYTPPAG